MSDGYSKTISLNVICKFILYKRGTNSWVMGTAKPYLSMLCVSSYYITELKIVERLIQQNVRFQFYVQVHNIHITELKIVERWVQQNHLSQCNV